MVPLLPQSLLCFCSVCVWEAPEGSLDVHDGYDIRFRLSDTPGDDGLLFSKENSEFFHVITEEIENLAPISTEDIIVEV